MVTPLLFCKISSLEKAIFSYLLLAGVAILTVFSSASVKAQGNLLITPRRVVFEGNKASQELNLANIGKDTAKYVVSILEIRMTDEGLFQEITVPDSGQRFAEKYLRFFPRMVTLGPSESQVVKIQLIKTNEMVPGEYRSHVYFRAIPNMKPLGEAPEPVKDSTTIAVKLIPVFGITIPVIIQKGESNAAVSLSHLSLEMVNDTTPKLNLTFKRTGNMSVFGDVTVNYISPDGKSSVVGIIKGLAVYTPNPIRYFHLELQKLPGVDYHKGKLHVVYSTQAEAKPSVKLAEADLQLNR